MFMDAISYVARITRVLRQPKGNMLLLGSGRLWETAPRPPEHVRGRVQDFLIEITRGTATANGADSASFLTFSEVELWKMASSWSHVAATPSSCHESIGGS